MPDPVNCTPATPGTPTAQPSAAERAFVLRIVQPGLMGLMDGSVSTLAPLFAAAGLTGESHAAFIVGLAAALGAGISMGFAEALSDDGELSGRGNPYIRGAVTGGGTFIGGMGHTLPFLIANLQLALLLAYGVVVVELLAIAWIRWKYMRSPLRQSIVQIIVGGGVVFGVGIWLGSLGAGG